MHIFPHHNMTHTVSRGTPETAPKAPWESPEQALEQLLPLANHSVPRRAFPSALRHARAVSDIVASHGPTSPVEFQHHLEVLMLHVFVEALWGIEPTAFPGEGHACAGLSASMAWLGHPGLAGRCPATARASGQSGAERFVVRREHTAAAAGDTPNSGCREAYS